MWTKKNIYNIKRSTHQTNHAPVSVESTRLDKGDALIYNTAANTTTIFHLLPQLRSSHRIHLRTWANLQAVPDHATALDEASKGRGHRAAGDLGDGDSGSRLGGNDVDVDDRNEGRLSSSGSRSVGLATAGSGLGFADGLDHGGVAGGDLSGNADDVLLAEAVLREARVELDDLLDGVEVVDRDLERVLDNHEGHALGAGGSGERAAVLEHIGGRDVRLEPAEVDALLDLGLGERGFDLGERGRDAGDDWVGFSVAELEHESDNGNLSGIGCVIAC